MDITEIGMIIAFIAMIAAQAVQAYISYIYVNKSQSKKNSDILNMQSNTKNIK